MEKPAVKQQATTAGKSTKQLKKYIASAGAGMAFLLLCAFSPKMQAEALTPPAQETKTVTVTEKIPFETTYVDLPNTYRGYTELVSEGVMGERQVEAQVIYEGDQVVRVVSIKTTETGRPVNQVVRRGTKLLRTPTADGSVWKTAQDQRMAVSGFLRLPRSQWDRPRRALWNAGLCGGGRHRRAFGLVRRVWTVCYHRAFGWQQDPLWAQQ